MGDRTWDNLSVSLFVPPRSQSSECHRILSSSLRVFDARSAEQ